MLLVGGTIRSSVSRNQLPSGNISNQIDISTLFEGGTPENNNNRNLSAAKSLVIDSPTPRFQWNAMAAMRMSKSETKPPPASDQKVQPISEARKEHSHDIISKFRSSLKTATEEKIMKKIKMMQLK